jgi:hypothetical protein
VSRVGSIISNLQTTLQGINGIAPYTNAITNSDAQIIPHAVYESRIAYDGYPNFSIVFNSEQRQKEPGRLKKILSVDIVCAFRDPQTNEVESWLADIEKVLSIDVTRGGNAYETWIPSMQRNSDVSEEIQIYIINVEIRTLADFGTL